MNPRPLLVYSCRYNIRACGIERLHPFGSLKNGRTFAELRARGLHFTHS